MTDQITGYQLWINWDHSVVSFHEETGFDVVSFPTQLNYQANIRILQQSGFRFQ